MTEKTMSGFEITQSTVQIKHEVFQFGLNYFLVKVHP